MSRSLLAALMAVAGLSAACSQDPSAPEAAPAATPPTSSPVIAADTATTGSGLTGSVSGLTGDVTAFQVEETATQIIVDLAADVLFAFDSAELSAQAPEQLRKAVGQIQRGGSGEIRVVGHTDAQGDDAYNDDLSLRRAKAVATWLAGAGGIAADRLESEGRGEREPVAPNEGSDGNDYPEGRAMNRRVQVIIPKA